MLEMTLQFKGPFRSGRDDESALPNKVGGVYVATIETPRGRFITYVGEGFDIRLRWWFHFQAIRGGYYQVYDQAQMASGEKLEKINGQDNESFLLTKFTKELADVAWEDLTSYDWYWAEFVTDAKTRKSVESAILATLKQSNASHLVQNARISVGPAFARKVRLSIEWPPGVQIEGLPPVINYGEIELPACPTL